tara:strand:+ start:69 stop:776 length:708 start_codon:yes stop_codon:yes gene_type:complete
MLNRIIDFFIPPILRPSVIYRIMNYILRGKDKFSYEKNSFKRQSFINRAIKKFPNCNYLEIGVADDAVFNTIPLRIGNKIGVDPMEGGTHRMTSDKFFETNKKKFDVIFIDGLHEYEQCQKDCINSLEYLNNNGVILFHDFLPKNYLEEKVPRSRFSIAWSGNVWKVAVELMHSKNIDFKIVNIDRGIGILKPKNNYEYIKLDKLKNQDFKNFINEYYKDLPIIDCDQGFDFIDK